MATSSGEKARNWALVLGPWSEMVSGANRCGLSPAMSARAPQPGPAACRCGGHSHRGQRRRHARAIFCPALELRPFAHRDPERREKIARFERQSEETIARFIAEQAAAVGMPLPLDAEELAAIL